MIKGKKIISAGFFGLIVVASLASCHKSPPKVSKNLQTAAKNLIGTLSKNQASVLRLYPGPDGLVGVIYKTGSGAMRVVWMTPTGAALVTGPVITATGQDLTALAQEAIDAVSQSLSRAKESAGATSPPLLPGTGTAPALGEKESFPSSSVSASPAQALLNKKMSPADFLMMSRHLKSVKVGRGPRKVWIYFDPNCIFCNRLWEEMKPYEKDVTAYWIPVAFMKKDDSLGKATGLLQAPDPLKALERNESAFDTGSEEGGMTIPAHLDPTLERAVATSTIGLGQATGELATPTIVFRDVKGRPQSSMGLPADLKTFLTGVGS